MDVGGDFEAQQLALAWIELPLPVAGSVAPVGAGATVPAPRSPGLIRVVVLRESAFVTAEVGGSVTGARGHQRLGGEVVVDLGVGGAVPTGAAVLFLDSLRAGAPSNGHG